MSAVPGLPSAEQLSALPAAGLAVRLAGAYRLIAELTGQVERLTALNERLSARVDELERRARQDSSTSPRPPSSDGPHKKEKRSTDRSLRDGTQGELPAHVRARASYGPEACAQAANRHLRDLFNGHAWKPPGREPAG